MKIVHCLGWYFPESTGGTEVYVHGLALELKKLGVEVAIMAPRDGTHANRYEHDGVEVLRYPVPQGRDLDQHEGQEPHELFEIFQQQLGALSADLFHLHSLTYGAGLHHLRQARALGLATVTSAHVPGVVCARGTMMRFGRDVCDGLIDPAQCVPCWLAARGLPETLALSTATALRFVPEVLTRQTRGRARAVLRAPALIDGMRRTLLQVSENSDRVVAVCAWLYDALRQNGVPEEKLLLCRQGVMAVSSQADRGPLPHGAADTSLRIGYFGRGARVKGIDVLVRAVRSVPPSCPVTLRVQAVINADEDRSYMQEVRAAAASDQRIRFVDPVPVKEVQASMRQCDVVAVPSRWLETGPLVAMEALAAGIPVLGSDLGGLKELIEPGVTGWLLPPNDVASWARQIQALARPGGVQLSWDSARAKIASTAAVAERMLATYCQLATKGR